MHCVRRKRLSCLLNFFFVVEVLCYGLFHRWLCIMLYVHVYSLVCVEVAIILKKIITMENVLLLLFFIRRLERRYLFRCRSDQRRSR